MAFNMWKLIWLICLILIITTNDLYFKGYDDASKLCVEYSKVKGPGTQAKPEKHQFFKRIVPIINRTLEKCERENGMM